MPTKSSRVTFHPVTVSEALAAGAEDLVTAHSVEVEPFQEIMGVGIDWASCLAEERRGGLKILGAWSQGELVGYAAFSLQKMTQRSNTLVAFNRGLYMSPELRGHGLELISQAEKFAADCGAKAVMQDTLEQHSTEPKRRASLGDVLVRKGYRPYARLFLKVL